MNQRDDLFDLDIKIDMHDAPEMASANTTGMCSIGHACPTTTVLTTKG